MEAGPSRGNGSPEPILYRHRHTVGQDPNAIEETISMNRRIATPFMLNKCEREAPKNWDIFYKKHEDRFFKNKNWTEREFAEEIGKVSNENVQEDRSDLQDGIVEKTVSNTKETVLLEVGSGPGNTLYPILTFNNEIKAYACDFSKRAIDILKMNPKFDSERVHAFVHDLVTNDPPLEDVVTSHQFGAPTIVSLVFVLSAIPPQHHRSVLGSLVKTLRPGGTLCFRDFAHGDLAQLRFHSKASAAWCEPSLLSDESHFYRRGDNTFAYFFTQEELEDHARALDVEGTIEPIEIHGMNRKTGVHLHRRFIQAKWKLRSTGSN